MLSKVVDHRKTDCWATSSSAAFKVSALAKGGIKKNPEIYVYYNNSYACNVVIPEFLGGAGLKGTNRGLW